MLLVASIRADDQSVKSNVESVGLFKNGLALVSRTIELPGPGSFRIDDMPTPVHGTFFIESSTKITARSTMQLVDVPMNLSDDPLQDQLAGKTVRITLKDKPEVFTGRVADLAATKKQDWDRDYDQARYRSYYYGQPMPAGNEARFLIIDGPDRVLIDQATIQSIRIEDGATTIKKRKPVLILTTDDATAPKQVVRISYLTNGLAWAPSYRVDLLDDKQLAIEQTAVVKNELLDLKDVEVYLISGYPSISFSHVTSPLSLEQKWSSFFQQLSMRPGRAQGGAMVQQQVVSNRAPTASADSPVIPADESIDIHYQPIGRQSLAEGDALSLSIAAGKAEYERIVEWTVPDNRDANGRCFDQYQREQFPEKFEDAAWDAVKFKNPLTFAMTTAPAMFMRDGKFLGQTTSTWVNAAESTTLRITKALSIRTSSREQEDPQKEREIVWVAGNDFRKVSVKGTLSVENFRKVDAKIIIKRQFSGELVKADENPKVTLREEGVWSVNQRNEMEWTITLKPGEKKTLEYSYTVLVDN
jgi:hypothetical protein